MKKLITILVGTMLAIGVQAQALVILPGDADYYGNQTGVSEIESAISALGVTLGSELYKQDVDGPETGLLAGSYTTEFFNTPTDPSDATISWVTGTPIIGDPKYLLVKDGNQEPAWYLFDLTNSPLVWDGMETLSLNDFWPKQGAISHVSLYGTSVPVPEPGTMMLLGVGMFGLAIFGKRRMSK